jgi:hypothetical protein
MRTINKLLIYKFTAEQKLILKSLWVVNGCWWAKWFKFEYLFSLVKWIVWKCNKVKAHKLWKLFTDFQLLCNFTHDIDFYLWWSLKDFYRANMQFIEWILKLLHWSSWHIRWFVAIILFLWLNIIWLFYFHYRKKRIDIKKLKLSLH